jgi:predicted phage terminase large subunit-like protein
MSRLVPPDHVPHPTQQAFLLLDDMEAFYGGAAGGGKSDALLMAALQYEDIPHYRALILRRTFPELSMAGAIMDRAKDWLLPQGIAWNSSEHVFTFPSGASLTFAHAQYEDDVRRFASTEFHFIGVDEVTRFTEWMYRFMFSRLRKTAGDPIPLRMRSASNPGDIGHEWVKARFVKPGDASRPFIPARLKDNPSLDQDQYLKSLAQLHPVERRRLLEGDWDVAEAGAYFRRGWFRVIEEAPKRFVRVVRYWDLAGTPPDGRNDPDWTAGFKMGLDVDKVLYGLHMQRFRASFNTVEQMLTQTAMLDGRNVPIFIEQEPGSAGKAVIAYFKKALQGYTVHGVQTTKGKTERAAPVASQAEAGNVVLVNGPWVAPFLDECEAFPTGAHDDQVDAMTGAFEALVLRPASTLVSW